MGVQPIDDDSKVLKFEHGEVLGLGITHVEVALIEVGANLDDSNVVNMLSDKIVLLGAVSKGVTDMTKAAWAVDVAAARGKRLLASLQQFRDPSPEQQYPPVMVDPLALIAEPLHDTIKWSVPGHSSVEARPCMV